MGTLHLFVEACFNIGKQKATTPSSSGGNLRCCENEIQHGHKARHDEQNYYFLAFTDAAPGLLP